MHFRIEKRFAKTGMKKAKERGEETAEKLDAFSVLASFCMRKKKNTESKSIRCFLPKGRYFDTNDEKRYVIP